MPSPVPEAVVGLTAQERQRLHESAVKYAAPTPQEAVSVARNLGFLIQHGHPSNMCGPLAIAILRDAGLIDRYVILHDYWLLDPRELADARALQSVFPERGTVRYESDTSVGEFDFAAFPLQAGDLLYLRAGLRGTYEHVIVVTRVDEQGRAFSVTNVNTEAGFVIKEILLYDPRQPGVGAFYAWTDVDNAHLGLTGCGGFQLWRLTQIVRPEDSEARRALCGWIDRVLASRGGHWRILIRRVGGDVIYYRHAEERFDDPSALQVPTALVFFHALGGQGAGDYESFLYTHGTQDRSFGELLGAVLLGADQEAARALARWAGGYVDAGETLADWGLDRTSLLPGQSTAWDTALALEGLYDGSLVSEESRVWVLGTMTMGAGRLGTLREHLEDVRVYGVRADAEGDRLFVSEAAIVDLGGESYVLVVHGSEPGYGEGETTAEDLAQAVEEVALAFGDGYVRFPASP